MNCLYCEKPTPADDVEFCSGDCQIAFILNRKKLEQFRDLKYKEEVGNGK